MRQTRKQAFNASELIPIMCEEVLPGDTWQHKENIVARLATPIAPILDDLDLETFYFFVPNRILWDGWEDFITGTDTTSTMPGIVPATAGPVNEVLPNSVFDHFGLLPGTYTGPGFGVSNLPILGYFKIWNEWFRDQNLQDNGLPAVSSAAPTATRSPKTAHHGSNAAPHQQTPRLLHKLTSVAAKRDAVSLPLRATHQSYQPPRRQSRKTILHQRSHDSINRSLMIGTGASTHNSAVPHTPTDPWIGITGLEADMAAVPQPPSNNIRLLPDAKTLEQMHRSSAMSNKPFRTLDTDT